MGDELAAAIRLYGRNSSGGGTDVQRPLASQVRRRAPRTHLHAELVRKRRDPKCSPKQSVQAALEAASAGSSGAVEALLARSGEAPVAEEWQARYRGGAQAFWDHFYQEKTVNFFKDRNYLREEFGELMPPEVSADPRAWVGPLETGRGSPRSPGALREAMGGRLSVLEVGCAVGNGVIPLLRANPDLFAFACDLSPVAVGLLRGKEEYRCGRCLAFACDVTRGVEQPTAEHEPLEAVVPAGVLDFATLLFVLSAIDPAAHRGVMARLRSRLRPGGVALVRDYGRGDLAQLRFAPGHWLGGDLYVRGDGTLALFLTVEGLAAAFEAEGFETLSCEFRRREIVNRGTGLRMHRVWIQGKFRRRG